MCQDLRAKKEDILIRLIKGQMDGVSERKNDAQSCAKMLSYQIINALWTQDTFSYICISDTVL